MSNHTLKITLKSDLCAGSGYAFNGLIDSDVCYDEYGIPYIPGRRLKGCFKETADILNKACNEFITKTEIEKLFGRSGDKSQGVLTVDNAYIEDYEIISSDMKDFISGYEFITPQKILEQYTSVKAQTRLDEEGIALDNTLRYTRTVNHYKIDGSSDETRFYANVSVDEKMIDNNLFEKLVMIVKATRNIGMNRNRGLGSIECCFDDEKNTTEKEPSKTDLSGISGLKPADKVIITYSVVNKAPLMLSMENDEVSENYIPGRNVLGALAGLYLGGDKDAAYENKDKKIYKKEFADLFLNGTTEYSNLYISKENKEYYPAPLFVNKLKKTEKYVNVSVMPSPEDFKKDESLTVKGLNPGLIYGKAEDGKKIEMSGNMPKKLKGKFLYISDDNKIPKGADIEPEMQVDFHHTKKSKKKDLNGKVKSNLLYSNLVIKENQTFRGSIITTKEHAERIVSLLDNPLRFGKSKSAQYGKCEVQQGIIAEPYKTEKKTTSCKKGDKLLVSFISDAIFSNDRDYTVNYEDVKKAVAIGLGIKYKKTGTVADEEKCFSLLSTKMIFGYNTVWNLRTAPVPAIEAGSTLVYEISEDCDVAGNKNVGGRNLEGYGRVKLFSDIDYDMNPENKDKDDDKKEEQNRQKLPTIKWEEVSETAEIIRRIVSDEIIQKCTEDVSDTDVKSASQLGRITLMLKQSNSYGDFIRRIKSIKKDADAIKGFLARKICENSSDDGLKKIKADKVIKDEDVEGITRVIDMPDGFKKSFLEETQENGNWKKILMTYLTKIKYENKLKDYDKGGE